jgi:hypothetical protein
MDGRAGGQVPLNAVRVSVTVVGGVMLQPKPNDQQLVSMTYF